jgi:hypothetical protein
MKDVGEVSIENTAVDSGVLVDINIIRSMLKILAARRSFGLITVEGESRNASWTWV